MKQILTFILFSLLLCWLMFAPIYKHVLIMRQALLQKEVDYLLEIGTNANHGYIDGTMIAQSRERLAQHGFSETDIVYDITTTNGQQADSAASRVIRGEGIQLTVSYPYQELFLIDRLIGIEGPDESARMGARGMQMSEYVP
ncbi:hypothetical protein [Marinicrinis sediminis]|uniref:ABC transporter permease n=1 Tax=Marinicrinis sediminis TaxID=1652465 RepID=A0ABW5RD57_9BACL